ncbi:GH92 family glycosyl hydrolase [Autumnicola musiva]|uniref:GH92 family glycosyl hydrolase n=1 Tax=Autumnicola musiva TaxID=3075589 RepID=A0ABU3D9Y5_9FLAO|nr:GH92 family glycosyl hydrolase [Zunongwangia sp. F117]MDT0678344.1 GH92 family glycosyl hydrolase [Zunongwangia sp. F117]
MKYLRIHIAAFLIMGFIDVASLRAQESNTKDFVDYVNPYIGNISHLLKPTHPAVHLPNSYLCLTPDRYDYTDVTLRGLPLVRSEGYYSAFHLSPFQGDVNEMRPVILYGYDNEKVTPYSYSVILDKKETEVNFGVSHQSAIYQVKFEEEEDGYLILNSARGEMKWDGKALSGHQVLEKGVHAYLYLLPDHVPTSSYVLENNKLTDKSQTEGKNASIVLKYSKETKKINLRYGISFISVEQAKKNMEREVLSNDIADLQSEGKKIWNNTLNKIKIEGGSEDDKTVFYTALYRNFRFPVSISEDGNYFSPFDGKIREDNINPFYSGLHDSGWNAYLGVRPLATLLEPEREEKILNSMLEVSSQLEYFRMPRYIGLTEHKVGMISNHYIISFLDAYNKGITDFDLEKAFRAGKSAVMERTLAPVSDEPAGELNRFYQEHGYVPALWEGQKEKILPQVKPFTNRMALAVTLGTAHDDWALAQMAEELDMREDFNYFCERSFNYRKLFNYGTGFFHPRDKSGRFILPIDYVYSGGLAGRDFYDESNGWIYRFALQYNIEDGIDMMGGKAAFASNLDELFSKPFPGKRNVQLYRYHNQTGIVGHFSMGNEPSFHIPYLYNYLEKPWETQKRIRILMKQWFRNDLLGIPGDEDAGALSAFFVFSSMGFYPVSPGIPIYNIGSPVFNKINIRLSGNRNFKIIAKDNSEKNKYIQSAVLNGEPLNKPWFSHSDVIKGGRLTLQMGPRPNKEWGIGPDASPPSMPLLECSSADK